MFGVQCSERTTKGCSYCTGPGPGMGQRSMGSNKLCRSVHTAPRQDLILLFPIVPLLFPVPIPTPCSVINSAIHQVSDRAVFFWYNSCGTEKIPKAVNGRTVSEQHSCWWRTIRWFSEYRSETVNSNMVNSKFYLISKLL